MAMGYGADDPGRADTSRQAAFTAIGILLVLQGAEGVAWIVRTVTRQGDAAGDYFKALIDPTTKSAIVAGAQPYTVALVLAALVTGFVALARRKAARGAAVVVAAVTLYLNVRALVGLHEQRFRDYYLKGPLEAQLQLATFCFELVVGLVVLVVALRAGDGQRNDAPMGYGQGSGW